MREARNRESARTPELDSDQQDSARVAALAASQVYPESALPSRPDYDAQRYLTDSCPSTAVAQLTDVMIDIETLGTTPGSAILSIGAVMFGRAGLGEDFYAPISLASCTEVGLTIDPATVSWWMRQSDAARAAAFRDDAEQLPVVLLRFASWLARAGADRPWCHGANFDAPLLEAAYRACYLTPPWKFWNVRDTRTLYELADVRVDRARGTHHNALDDAQAQAEAAVVAIQRLQDAGSKTQSAPVSAPTAGEQRSDNTAAANAAGLPPPELTWLYTHCRAIGMDCKSESGKWEHDIALFTNNQRHRITDLEAELAKARAAGTSAGAMPVEQEPKYGIRDNQLFNRASGEFIPSDEPVFIFRARDAHAVNILAGYAREVSNADHAQAVWERVEDFKRFWDAHPERMKQPDTDRAAAKSTADQDGAA